MSEKGADRIPEDKKKAVADLVDIMLNQSIVGIVNLESLPTAQLQKMRSQLRSTVDLLMSKKRLIKIALEEAEKKKQGIKGLEKYLIGMPALLATGENPFTLMKTLKKNMSSAPIKGGQTTPDDIIVPAGPTGFSPGPIISQLGNVGIKTGIDAGKIVVKEDCTVAKAGDVISQDLASILGRLGIEPLKIGLNLVAVYEDGEIVEGRVLDIDEDKFKEDLAIAGTNAFNLAIEIAYPSKDTIECLIAKAATNSRSLAISENILNEETAGDVLNKANSQAVSLKNTANL